MNNIFKFIPNLYTFAKDTKSRFICCNETIAEAINLDSPCQIVGKTDYDLCWKDKADFYRRTDSLIIKHDAIYTNVVETQKQSNKNTDILITKRRLLNQDNKCIGVIGSYIDINGHFLIKSNFYLNKLNDKLYLGDTFNNEYLTKREVDILKCIILGYTMKKIGLSLNISYRTVEHYITVIKYKLQCKTKGDIMYTVIMSGLNYYIL